MILAMKHQNKVYMIIDSHYQGIIGISDDDYINTDNINVWQPKETKNVLISYQEGLRENDILRYHLKVNEPITFNYLQSIFLVDVKEILSKYGYCNEKRKLDKSLIVATKNSIYYISQWMLVEEIEEIKVLGTYYDIVLEMFYKKFSNETLFEDRIKKTMYWLSKYSNSTTSQLTIFSLEDLSIKHLEFTNL
jgi:hypothetical protein